MLNEDISKNNYLLPMTLSNLIVIFLGTTSGSCDGILMEGTPLIIANWAQRAMLIPEKQTITSEKYWYCNS